MGLAFAFFCRGHPLLRADLRGLRRLGQAREVQEDVHLLRRGTPRLHWRSQSCGSCIHGLGMRRVFGTPGTSRSFQSLLPAFLPGILQQSSRIILAFITCACDFLRKPCAQDWALSNCNTIWAVVDRVSSLGCALPEPLRGACGKIVGKTNTGGNLAGGQIKTGFLLPAFLPGTLRESSGTRAWTPYFGQ